MANFLYDIGSFFVGFVAGSMTGRYGRQVYRMLVNYTEPHVFDWGEECERIKEEPEPEAECECQCGKQKNL